MGSLLSFLIHPFDALQPKHQDNDGNINDLLYHLTLCVAFGIWTVARRYQNAQNRAIPFRIPSLEVRLFHDVVDHVVLKKSLQAAEPKFTGKMISNATIESHKSDSTLLPSYTLPECEYITSFDPATGYHLGTYVADSVEDIERKIQKASDAQKDWRRTTFADRRRVVRSLKKWLVENQEVCARTACRDTGKTHLEIVQLL